MKSAVIALLLGSASALRFVNEFDKQVGDANESFLSHALLTSKASGPNRAEQMEGEMFAQN